MPVVAATAVVGVKRKSPLSKPEDPGICRPENRVDPGKQSVSTPSDGELSAEDGKVK